jgi:Tfp pilus assembly protein FimT
MTDDSRFGLWPFGLWTFPSHAFRFGDGNHVGCLMNRRSVSLVEVLIAVALLLGIAAIVTPSVVNSLDERAFESAADVTGEQLMLARAHAQATGQTIEVRYRPEKSAVEARIFAPWLGHWARSTTNAPGGSEVSTNQPSTNARDDRDGPSLIPEPWANRSINKSVRIACRVPLGVSQRESSGMSLTPEEAAAIEAELTNTDDVRLAVFMPDGSALLGDPFWLEDGDGRMGKLTVNPFSGLPIWERLEDLTGRALKLGIDADDAGMEQDEADEDVIWSEDQRMSP